MADTEEKDQRPSCEKWIPEGTPCGAERALKRIKYSGPTRDSIYCPKHFDKEWADPDANEAEPVKTGKD